MSESKGEFVDIKAHWAKRLTDYLSGYPLNFKDFVGDPGIIKFGDSFLARYISTGYNYATNEQFRIMSQDSLVFYGMYAQRIPHLSELLATMERREIIKPENISFGIKATKIVGDYTDPEPEKSWITMADGQRKETRESIEAVITFHPTWPGHAIDIVDFLLNDTKKIEGCYADPDTRTTATRDLRAIFLSRDILKLARSNIYKFKNGNLIMLKQTSPFGGDWDSTPTLVHPRLFEYLISKEVAA